MIPNVIQKSVLACVQPRELTRKPEPIFESRSV
jgi:hypothetical protein